MRAEGRARHQIRNRGARESRESDVIPFDQPRGEGRIPARHRNQSAAGEDSAVEAVDESRDLVHRRDPKKHRLPRLAVPQRKAGGRMQDAAVRVTAALGLAAGAGSVIEDRQVARIGRGSGRHLIRGDDGGPCMATAHGARRRGHPFGELEIAWPGQVIRVARDDDFAGPPDRELYQFLRANGDLRAAVGQDARQFGRAIHGIYGNHHRVREQRAVVGNHPLRRILHVERNAVTGLDAAATAQPSGEGRGLFEKARIRDVMAEERNGDAIGCARGRSFETVRQRDGGGGQGARQMRGPVCHDSRGRHAGQAQKLS